jgi:hypothetical protein
LYTLQACFPEDLEAGALDGAPPFVRQLDIRDPDGDLIPPWAWANAFMPGAYISAWANLVCYLIAETNRVTKVKTFKKVSFLRII